MEGGPNLSIKVGQTGLSRGAPQSQTKVLRLYRSENLTFSARSESTRNGRSYLSIGSGPSSTAYDFGSRFSIILSMLKLAALARGGNSLKDSNHWATSACTGTNIKR